MDHTPDLVCTEDDTHCVDPATWQRAGWKARHAPTSREDKMSMSTDHDYTDAERRLGHDYTFTPGPDGLTASATGWGGGIKKGDVIWAHRPKRRRFAVPRRTHPVHGKPAGPVHGRLSRNVAQ